MKGKWRGIFPDEMTPVDFGELFLNLTATEAQAKVILGQSPIKTISAGRRSGKCLVGSSLVSMADGSLKPIKSIERGDMVLGVGDDLRVGPVEVLGKIDSGFQSVFTLTTLTGKRIIATGNHPFFTEYGWRELKDISKGDFVAIPRFTPSNGIESVCDGKFKLVAYLLADGCLTGTQISYCKGNSRLVDELRSEFSEVYGGTTYSKWSDSKNVWDVRFHRNDPFLFDLSQWGMSGKGARSKEIPEFVFKGSNRQVALFLSRLYGGDGWAYMGGGKGEVGYSTTSEVFARQVSSLLLRFGIVSRVDYKPKFKSWSVVFWDSDMIRRFSEIIGIFGKEGKLSEVVSGISSRTGSFDRIPKGLMPFTLDDIDYEFCEGPSNYDMVRKCLAYNVTRRKAKDVAELIDSDELRILSSSDLYWDAVKSIEWSGASDTYDIEVPETSNFIADGILVHNSHIMAVDVLHRALTRDSYTQWVVALSSDQAGIIFDKCIDFVNSSPLLAPFLKKVVYTPFRKMVFTNGSEIHARSCSHNGKYLRGHNADRVVVDEAAFVPEEIVDYVIAPMLTDTGGDLVLISTPWGSNYFKTYYDKGLAGEPGHSSFHFTSFDNINPITGEMNISLDYLNRMKESTPEIVWRNEYCLPPESLVIGDGVKPIVDHQVGDMVFTHRGHLKPVTDVMCRDYDGDLVEVSTIGSAGAVRLTPEHPVLTRRRRFVRKSHDYRNNNILEWIPAGELKAGDYVYYPKRERKDIESVRMSDFIDFDFNYDGDSIRAKKSKGRWIPNTIPLDSRLLRMLGLWVAEGCVGSKGNSLVFSINSDRVDLIDEVESDFKDVFGLTVSKHHRDDNVVNVVICNKIICSFFSELCGRGAANKRFHPILFNLPPNKSKHLLTGYFDGDGCLFSSKLATSSSVSEILAVQVRDMLAGFNISSSVVFRPGGDTTIKGRNYRTKDSFINRINSKDAEAFYNRVFGDSDDLTAVDRHRSPTIDDITGFQNLVSGVRRVPYSGKVYNLEVDGDNSYLTKSFVVHNCAEFIEDQNFVFKWGVIRECVFDGNTYWGARPDRQYIVGVDIAKTEDYSAIVVLDCTDEVARVVWSERFQLPYDKIKEKIISVADAFVPYKVMVDETGVGASFPDDLRVRIPGIEGVFLSGGERGMKVSLVNGLRLALESSSIAIPGCGDTSDLINELKFYEYKMTPHGNVKYEASKGFHDDFVMALGLAWLPLVGKRGVKIESRGLEKPNLVVPGSVDGPIFCVADDIRRISNRDFLNPYEGFSYGNGNLPSEYC